MLDPDPQPAQMADVVGKLDALLDILRERAKSPVVPLQVKREDAATMSGVSVPTWDRMTAAGENPAPIHLGRVPFWRVEDLRGWIAAGCPKRTAWEALRRRRIT